MTTITRKRAELRAFITGFLSDPADDNQSANNMTAEVFRIALAAMDAEPMFYVDVEAAKRVIKGHTRFATTTTQPKNGTSLPLYLYPPVPVVSDEIDMLQSFGNSEQLNSVNLNEPVSETNKLRGTMPDYEGETMTQRECYQAGKKAGNYPVIPDGWVIVPKKLTAENGAKYALSGDFSETVSTHCPECFGDDECDTCDGSGKIEIKAPVSWTTIKAIWAKGVEHFAAAPQQEVNRD